MRLALLLLLLVASSLVAPPLTRAQHDTAFVDYAGDSVRIRHINVLAYCNSAFVNMVDVRQDSVIIVERDTSIDHARCLCKFDLSTALIGLHSGTYQVWLYRAYNLGFPAPRDTQFLVQTLRFSVNKWNPPPAPTLAFQTSGCHASPTPDPVPACFPLNLGDRWEYGDGARREVIGDTVTSRGKQYRVILEWRGAYSLREYQRVVGNQVYQLSPPDTAEYLKYDFSLGPGSIVRQWPRHIRVDGTVDTTYFTLQWAGYQTVDGVPRRRWYFREDTPVYTDANTDFDVVDSIGLVASYGAKILREWKGAVIDGKVYGTVTGVSGPVPCSSSFVLSQNYPNPFNPTTTIRYTLPRRCQVMLAVYNTLGQRVAVLVQSESGAGTQEVRFDASNLASGVYFYRLYAGSFVGVKQLCIVK